MKIIKAINILGNSTVLRGLMIFDEDDIYYMDRLVFWNIMKSDQ